MIKIATVTGDGTSNLYQLCAVDAGNSIPIQYNSTAQNNQSNWPDPVSSVQITTADTGTIKDLTTGQTVVLSPTASFIISDVLNSISLQSLLISNALVAKVIVNSK